MKRLLYSDKLPERVRRAFIICLNPRAGKMKRIPRSDWLPERARWAHPARSGFYAFVLQEKLLFLAVSFIYQACSVFVCVFIDLDFVSVHKIQRKNSADMQLHLDVTLKILYLEQNIFFFCKTWIQLLYVLLRCIVLFSFSGNVCNGPYFTSHRTPKMNVLLQTLLPLQHDFMDIFHAFIHLLYHCY